MIEYIHSTVIQDICIHGIVVSNSKITDHIEQQLKGQSQSNR